MTSAPVFEELDLPTRRTQEPELGAGDLRLVQHQRVQLVQGEPLPDRLHDDQAAVIAQAASAALTVEKGDQLQPLPLVSVSLVFANGPDVLDPFLRCVAPPAFSS